MRDLAAEVREQRYEVAIDFQGLTKSALWTRLCGARLRIGFPVGSKRVIPGQPPV